MKIFRYLIPVLLLLTIYSIAVQSQENDKGIPKVEVTSPDGNIVFSFYQKTGQDGGKTMYYTLQYKNKQVILESRLNLKIDNHLSEQALALKVPGHNHWFENLEISKVETIKKDTAWIPLYGENRKIPDVYNRKTICFEKSDYPKYKMNLEIRVYNQGAAFRYFFPENPTGVYYQILSDDSEFTMPENTKAWFTSWAQGAYQFLSLKDWPDESERPLSLELENGIKISLLEANLSDFPRTKFKLSPEKPNTVITSMYGGADLVSPFYTPWRGIMVAEEWKDLVQNNDFIQNLCDPSQLGDNTWIKPGKIIRELTLTTEGAIACIDFAAQHNLQYILFDWKWYGPAMTFDSDAGKVVAPIDMKKVVDYGKERNVGVWLYVNQQALQKQADRIFPVYKSWGIKGVKFGFVELGSQRWTVWLEELIKKAAENQLMVNIHDEYRPTGTSRTWPNVLTQEGIRGNEEMPEATHNTILPFTRMIAGAADYTVCYYTNRIKTTHGHQLALPVIFYSPLQTLFWYDKPADYNGEPEIEFFEKVPAVWDETKVLMGEPGKFISIARRTNNDWFVGTITNNDTREIAISLDFLSKGKKYMAHIYSDDPSLNTRTNVRIEQLKVDASEVMKVKLLPSGGQAIWLQQL